MGKTIVCWVTVLFALMFTGDLRLSAADGEDVIADIALGISEALREKQEDLEDNVLALQKELQHANATITHLDRYILRLERHFKDFKTKAHDDSERLSSTLNDLELFVKETFSKQRKRIQHLENELGHEHSDTVKPDELYDNQEPEDSQTYPTTTEPSFWKKVGRFFKRTKGRK